MAELFFHNYRYFPYEYELAKKEAEKLSLSIKKKHSYVVDSNDTNKLEKLVYFSSFKVNQTINLTLQSKLERSCLVNGNRKRQSTKYSVHGIHEYRGKFNPQVVRAIINTLELKSDATIVDPFCGSGTTLVESSFANFNSLGIDINPLAVLISNSKILALSARSNTLRKKHENILKAFLTNKDELIDSDEQRKNYLKRWFEDDLYNKFEKLKSLIIKHGGKHKNIFLILASDLLRDYSLQEPSDLRIRKRKSPYPDISIEEAYKEKVNKFLVNLEESQKYVGLIKFESKAINFDLKNVVDSQIFLKLPKFDAAITSPPYATALPYIDTQRLSLVWLGLVENNKLKKLESSLIGTREFCNNKEKNNINNAFMENRFNLYEDVYRFCLKLNNSLSPNDGFRRRAIPSLMYKYFSDMSKIFISLKKLMKKNAPFVLLVGRNKTTLNNKEIQINTPELLVKIAEYHGWTLSKIIELQTYQRYDLHKKNSINSESLLLLRND